MPTYEYACKDCNTHIEVVQRFTDDPLTECHACGGRLRKVFGSIGITFKGSGFYRTDSRPAGGSGSPDKTGSDKGTEKTSAEKPAAEKKTTEKKSTDKSASGGSSSSGSADATAKSA